MIYKHFIRPVLFTIDPEWIHDVAIAVLSQEPAARLLGFLTPAPRKPVELWGLTFRNPLGIAAGFDKEAVLISAIGHLGFGFTEIGTVTRYAQPGNPKPRVFRMPSRYALLNRMGFPNRGADVIERILSKKAATRPKDFPLGINIGKSKITPLEEAAEDYVYTFQKLAVYGDFFVVNVSSPNTPGLRDLQNPAQLEPVLKELQNANADKKPLLVKIAPDLTDAQIADILEVIIRQRLDGIVVANTSIMADAMIFGESGGTSGRPVEAKSTEIVRFIHRETNGNLPIIGVGGVFTREDYRRKIDAGASLVQVYTGFVYEGPQIVSHILA